MQPGCLNLQMEHFLRVALHLVSLIKKGRRQLEDIPISSYHGLPVLVVIKSTAQTKLALK